MKKKAIVIGSGLGGLTTAVRLANRGLDVTLFEKRDKFSKPYRGDRDSKPYKNKKHDKGEKKDKGDKYKKQAPSASEMYEKRKRSRKEI